MQEDDIEPLALELHSGSPREAFYMDRPSGVIDPDGAKCALLRISTRVLLELLGIRLDIVRRDQIERAISLRSSTSLPSSLPRLYIAQLPLNG